MEESARSGARIVSASPSRWGKDGRGARLHSNCAPMVRCVPGAYNVSACCVCLCEPHVPLPETFGVYGNGAGFIEHILPSTDQYTFNPSHVRRTRPGGKPHFYLFGQMPAVPHPRQGRHGTSLRRAAACTCSLHLQPARPPSFARPGRRPAYQLDETDPSRGLI